MVWFALPCWDEERAEYIEHLPTNFNLCTIADQFCRCSTLSDVVLEGCRKIAVTFHTVDVSEKRFRSNEELGNFNTTVNSRSIRVDRISPNCLAAVLDIESKKE